MRKVLFVVMIGIGVITFHSKAFALDCDEVKSLGRQGASEAILHLKDSKKHIAEKNYDFAQTAHDWYTIEKESAAGWATIYNAFCKD